MPPGCTLRPCLCSRKAGSPRCLAQTLIPCAVGPTQVLGTVTRCGGLSICTRRSPDYRDGKHLCSGADFVTAPSNVRTLYLAELPLMIRSCGVLCRVKGLQRYHFSMNSPHLWDTQHSMATSGPGGLCLTRFSLRLLCSPSLDRVWRLDSCLDRESFGFSFAFDSISSQDLDDRRSENPRHLAPSRGCRLNSGPPAPVLLTRLTKNCYAVLAKKRSASEKSRTYFSPLLTHFGLARPRIALRIPGGPQTLRRSPTMAS
jgi:hypothetical protein